jgi:SAM-dependent methyltransferase
MRQRDQSIYASLPMRRLQADHMRAMTPHLQRCAGDYALMIGPSADDAPPPALPMLGCWVRMQTDGSRYRGDLKAAGAECLPFVDDAFELVLLRYALEMTVLPMTMLHEVTRVLAPGGVLAITGVHPLSVWAAWLRWRARDNPPVLSMPLRLMLDLQQEGFEIEQSQRTGCVLPSGITAHGIGSKMFGGGYVIIARKRRGAVTPLRIQPDRLQIPAGGRLSPSTRRSAAL